MKNLLLALPLIIIASISSDTQELYKKVTINKDRYSDHVIFVWGGRVYKDMVVAIATQKGLVIIDAGKSPTLTGEYRKIIENEFGRNDFIYLINTHHHFDHTGGNQVFPEATIISQQKVPELMKEWERNRQTFVNTRRSVLFPQWIEQRDKSKPGSEQWHLYNDIVTTQIIMLDDYENNFTSTLPDITFNDRMTIDLGDLTLKLFYFGEGLHTGDDIIIYCPEERLLFSGDLFNSEYFRFSFTPTFDAERQILALKDIFVDPGAVEWVYDCHHKRMPGEFVSTWYRYLQDAWELLKDKHKKGITLDQVLTDFPYEKQFPYIIKSGINEDALKEMHLENLKAVWNTLNKLYP